jgi:predicted nucleic acid-binding protein
LDTTFLIDAERDGLELEAAINDEDDVAVAAISVAEMLVGVELVSTKYRPRREAFVGDVVSSIPIVPYDLSVAGEHARLLAAVKLAGRPWGAVAAADVHLRMNGFELDGDSLEHHQYLVRLMESGEVDWKAIDVWLRENVEES